MPANYKELYDGNTNLIYSDLGHVDKDKLQELRGGIGAVEICLKRRSNPWKTNT